MCGSEWVQGQTLWTGAIYIYLDILYIYLYVSISTHLSIHRWCNGGTWKQGEWGGGWIERALSTSTWSISCISIYLSIYLYLYRSIHKNRWRNGDTWLTQDLSRGARPHLESELEMYIGHMSILIGIHASGSPVSRFPTHTLSSFGYSWRDLPRSPRPYVGCVRVRTIYIHKTSMSTDTCISIGTL